MSNFEYMGQVTIGQYLPLDSFLHRLDARARIFIFLFPLILITFEPKPVSLLLAIFLVLVGLLLAHIPLRYALRGLLPPLPFLLILAILQIFLARSQTPLILFKYGPLVLTWGGILAGITLLLRFTGLNSWPQSGDFLFIHFPPGTWVGIITAPFQPDRNSHPRPDYDHPGDGTLLTALGANG